MLRRNLTPAASQNFQSIKFISNGMKSAMRDVVLFYGWNDRDGQGTAYLWDARRE